MISPTTYACGQNDAAMVTRTMTEETYNKSFARLGYSRDCIGKVGATWWLRTPGSEAIFNLAYQVSVFGSSGWGSSRTSVWADAGVRPALYLEK